MYFVFLRPTLMLCIFCNRKKCPCYLYERFLTSNLSACEIVCHIRRCCGKACTGGIWMYKNWKWYSLSIVKLHFILGPRVEIWSLLNNVKIFFFLYYFKFLILRLGILRELLAFFSYWYWKTSKIVCRFIFFINVC